MRIAYLIALTALAACSSQPSTPQGSAPAASSEPVQAAAKPIAVAAESETVAFKPPPGYKARMREGEQVYCRKLVVLGSRFPQELCLTQEQLADLELRNQAMRDDMAQRNGLCTSGPGCASN